jgi:CBS-domain-containing membrane protein
LRRAELHTTRRRSWWLELFSAPERLAQEYVKTHAQKVGEVMSKPVISVTEATSLGEIASILERHGIKRVPVVSGRAVIGIVSRADLVKALARRAEEAPAETSDGAIRNTFLQRYRAQPWAPPGGGVSFTVSTGVVALSGLVNSAEQRAALAVMAETIPGVVKVENEIRVLPNLPMGV